MPSLPISNSPSKSTPIASRAIGGASQRNSVDVQQASSSQRRDAGNLSDLAGLSDSRAPRKRSPPPPLDIRHYLVIRGERSKNLVIGCGTTPEKVTMGNMQGTACSHGSDHHNDFTVDVSEDAHPNLTLDFSQYKDSDLHEHGKGRFDNVSFEYLNRGPRNRFSEAEIGRWIEGADALLNKSGKIAFYNGDRNYRAQARAAMEARGYKVTDKTEDPTPGSPNGHVYCEGVKDTSLWSGLSNLIKG